MRKPYEDEQRLYLVAEMQRLMMQDDPLGPERGIITGALAGAALAAGLWLLVIIWRLR